MNAVRNLLAVLICMTGFTTLQASDNSRSEIGRILKQLKLATEQQNYALIEADVDSLVIYDGVSCGGDCEATKDLFKRIVNQYPESLKLSDIELVELKAVRKDYKATVRFTYTDEKVPPQTRELIFDDKFKLLEIQMPYLAVKMGSDAEQAVKDGARVL